MTHRSTKLAGGFALSLCMTACASDTTPSGTVPWSNQRTEVVGDGLEFTQLAPASGSACTMYQTECLKPAEKCGTAAVDIVLDSKGKPLDYLCYPSESTLTVQDLTAQQGTIAQRDNNTVLLLDDLHGGENVTGPVSIDANNVVIYGTKPSAAVLAGSLTIDGNNALVRGLRIQGDVTIAKNDATLAFCVIEGNLTITGNNFRLLACDVLGTVSITGNNAQLYADHIAGSLSAQGKNADCKDDFAATDANKNLTIEAAEVGMPLSCK